MSSILQKKTILLVEDNPDDIELTLMAFSQHNLNDRVVVARDGQEALDYLFGLGTYAGRDISRQPNLILLDLKLPKVDGGEVLRRLRTHEQTRLIPVVVLTTSSEEPDIRNSYRLGANSYVRKPVDFLEFVGVVRQLGNYWMTINELPYH